MTESISRIFEGIFIIGQEYWTV